MLGEKTPKASICRVQMIFFPWLGLYLHFQTFKCFFASTSVCLILPEGWEISPALTALPFLLLTSISAQLPGWRRGHP